MENQLSVLFYKQKITFMFRAIPYFRIAQSLAIPCRTAGSAFALWGRGVLFASVILLGGFHALQAASPIPSTGASDKYESKTLPGLLESDGSFSNSSVANSSDDLTLDSSLPSDAAQPDSPGDLLDSAKKNSPGSDVLRSGNQSDEALPFDNAGAMTPMQSKPLGHGVESLLGGQESPETLPESAMGTFGQGSVMPIVGAPESGAVSATTKGREYEGLDVLDVQILGNSRNSIERIMQFISTRTGRPFRSQVLDDDIRRMSQSRLFVLVEPYIQPKDNGVIVIFNVKERPIMRYLKFQGNEAIRIATLERECGLVVGSPVSPYDVEEGRKKLELFYQSKGFAKVVVKTVQGDKASDPGVIFLINEGPKLRIGKTNFIGNTIVTGGRLKTVIQSKPGILWLFQGELREENLTDDVKKLEDYYRRLGFFYARVGRRVQRTSEKGWNDVTFVIHEGPQAKIRQIRYLGNDQFDSTMLMEDMKVFVGKPFNKDRLDQSIAKVRRRYGREGYVFADINAEARVLDDPSMCDIVFQIKEGKTYRVGRVNVLIEGEFPHTQVSTILNRLSVKPGDLVNVNELQHSERRLKSSQLFAADPAQGKVPKIVYSPPELAAADAEIKKQVGNRAIVPDREVPKTSSSSSSTSNGTSAGQASIGGGAGRAAVSGGSQKVFKCTIAEVDENFQLGENEELLDLTIYGVWNENAPVQGDENSDSQGKRADGNAAESIADETQVVCEPSEIVDPETGEVYRTFEYPDEAEVDLQGRVSVCNDDPAYADMPVRVVNRPIHQRVNYGGTASTTNTGTSSLDSFAAVPNEVPIQPIPSSSNYASTSPEPSAGNAYASNQAASPFGTAPAAQTASVNPQTGQSMSPPPQPGISNPDVTPYSQHVGDAPAAGYSFGDWSRQSLPITVQTEETTTGRLMFSLGISSDAGLVGSVVVEEQNFDIRRWPKSWSDIQNGTAWRGRGQHFRIEATPGSEVQRYAISFDEPYLFNSQIGLGTSLSYYDRFYSEWHERRMGGQLNLSRALTHDMRAYIGFRGYNVKVNEPKTPTPQRLADALGKSDLFGFSFRLVQDRRDSAFLATEGYYASIEFEQVIGTWKYPRFNAQFKKYWLLAERADMSGRHVLSLNTSFSWTGDDTPIYESYFAGGTTTIRGFEFRGASPRDMDVPVGGNMMLLASMEYLFPITADDMIRGVIFCDTGTVEPFINDWSDKYRVALGVGLRLSVPMLGSAPIALDFAFPVSKNDTDKTEVFSFTMGLQR